ncbi:hypothetical protein WUBG_05813 [Wuchereria bancrofti]|uniref:Uncharacterized protein n=1 Tax=Wuchereria bancrofti TaxID=6293 RepID=J9B888_WUCBA|nr:hypothetical protein WUBG_05813 [Wuchereria bancrofti]VDM08274.1 unnamed protein product [Wuchereria bancrofti]
MPLKYLFSVTPIIGRQKRSLEASSALQSIWNISQSSNQPARITTASPHCVHIDCTVLTTRRMRLLTTGAHSTARFPSSLPPSSFLTVKQFLSM